VSTVPDLDLARRFVAAQAPSGRVLLCGVTGSHQYGFSSADSDLDIKGIHVAPTRALVGLSPPAEAHQCLQRFDGVECDLTTNEAGQSLRLLLRGNGNMLERIFSPYQLYTTRESAELRELGQGAISKVCFDHYAGFFRAMCRDHERGGQPMAKTLLYAYRVALTGIHLLRCGEIVGDLTQLAPEYGFRDVLPLIELKRSGSEHDAVSPEEDAHHRRAWARLSAKLEAARDESPLPESPANAAACENWLVELRVRELGSSSS
jgi:hypothetical protein